jgi:hypothetical protein
MLPTADELGLCGRRSHGLQRSTRILAIDGYLTGTSKMPTQKRNSKQLLLCQKSKLDRQCNKNDGNIHVTLMIYTEHTRDSRFDVAQTFNGDPHTGGPENQPGPDSSAAMLHFAR